MGAELLESALGLRIQGEETEPAGRACCRFEGGEEGAFARIFCPPKRDPFLRRVAGTLRVQEAI